MLLDPKLALCSDRTKYSKKNNLYGEPSEWFSNEKLATYQLSSLSFDFFVDWSKNPPEIKPIFWIKKILSNKFSYLDFLSDLEINIEKSFTSKDFCLFKSLLNTYECEIQLVIFNDEQDWRNPSSEIILIDIKITDRDILLYKSNIVAIENFKNLIKEYSGGSVKIGAKGLIYGTSYLECLLSKTDSLYPGDVDCILFDEEFQPVAIIEYKKHNLEENITSQNLGRYYPNPDGRKYDRLALLKFFLERSIHNIPLLCLYYPTDIKFSEGRLELIGGSFKNLQPIFASNFNLPHTDDIDCYGTLIFKIKKAIAYFQKQF